MHLKSYILAYLKPELKAILKRRAMLIGIFLVMLIALWAMGFSNGVSRILAEKMDSPFIRFMDITIPQASYGKNNNLKKDLDSTLTTDEWKKRYAIEELMFVDEDNRDFLKQNGIKTERARIRWVPQNSSLLNFIKENKEIVLTNNFIDFERYPYSIIVTESFLKRLGYSDYPLFIQSIYGRVKDSVSISPLPIAGVVKQLPNKADIFLSKKAFHALTGRVNGQSRVYDPHFHLNEPRQHWYLIGDKDEENIKAILKEKFGENFKSIETSNMVFKPGYIVTLNTGTIALNTDASISDHQVNVGSLSLERFFPYESVPVPPFRPYQYPGLSLSFSNLDSVEVFARRFTQVFDIEPEMKDIESGKNFNLFNRISNLLSFILTLFAITILVYTISKAIIDHIDRNSANLGTLKAFGLANNIITYTYAIISLSIIVTLFIIAYIMAYIIGHYIAPVFLSQSLNLESESSQIYILPISFWLILKYVISPFIIISIVVNMKIKGKTPGDLIYGRV